MLVGDATASDDGGWGWAYGACVFDNTRFTSKARLGLSPTDTLEKGVWAEALDLDPDWLLIQFGCDGELGDDGLEPATLERYRDGLARMVDEARAAGARPVLITPLARRDWVEQADGGYSIRPTLEPFAEAVREVGKAKSAPVIDLHFRSLEVYLSLGRDGCRQISPNDPQDTALLNRHGGALFGSMVAMDCKTFVPDIDNCFRTPKLSALQDEYRLRPSGEPDGAFRRRAGALASQGERELVVDSTGGGDFRTLQAAVDAAPSDNSDRTTILLRPGVYTGRVVVPADKPNLSLIGESRSESVVSYALTVHDPQPAGVPRGYAGCGVVVLADGFHAENLTIRQVAGDHGQAIALRLEGDRTKLRGCDLLGWQDTLRLEGGRHRIEDCHIEGRVDYIYGGGTAWIENCTLHTKGPGYVTAASTPADRPWGYVFKRCQLTGTEPSSVHLGRPWRPNSSVTYLECTMSDCVRPEGWNNWRNPQNERTARYAEHASTGPGATPEERVAWSKQLTTEQAAAITESAVLGEDFE